MQIIEPSNSFKVRETVSCLQVDLESILQNIFARAGSKIQPEKREKIELDISKAVHLLEQLKIQTD